MKMTSLSRHHAAPKGAGEQAVLLRKRWSARSSSMRSSWMMASAAIFFLGETEAYLQTEIVACIWEAFSAWLTGSDARRGGRASVHGGLDGDGDAFLHGRGPRGVQRASVCGGPTHDPQTLSTAHTLYLCTLVHRLLLTQPTFTDPLYTLLVHIDHLVSHIRRLHSIFTAIDLEADAGVVDASVDLEREEEEVMALLRGVESKVRKGTKEVVEALRRLENDGEFLAEWESNGMSDDEPSEGRRYIPARLGGVDRLLMKLDFGSWLGSRHDGWDGNP